MPLALRPKLRGNVHTVAYLILAIFLLCHTGLFKKDRPTFFIFYLLLVLLFYSFALPVNKVDIPLWKKSTLKKREKKKKEVRYQTEVKLNEAQQRQWLYWPSDNCRSALMSWDLFLQGMSCSVSQRNIFKWQIKCHRRMNCCIVSYWLLICITICGRVMSSLKLPSHTNITRR